MGKGDIRTKKGKRVRGSYGKSRVRKGDATIIDQIKTQVAKDENLSTPAKAE